MKALNNFFKLYNETGLTGEGVTIGVIDHNYPEYIDGIPEEKVEIVSSPPIEGADKGSHGTNTLQVLISDDGMACGIEKIYYASLDDVNCPDGTSFYYGIEKLIASGVKVINGSIDAGYRGKPVNGHFEIDLYTTMERWMDYIINTYDITYLQAAGNNEVFEEEAMKYIYNLGLCYNSITVGAMNDQWSLTKEDDIVATGSAYRRVASINGNMVYGCLKPDFISPENAWGRGTSTATPVATSIVALMLQLKPSLAIHPQVIKAILMASCHRKAKDVDGSETEFMSEGLTLKQGAGVIDCYTALCIVGNSQYGERTIEPHMETDRFKIIQPKYNNKNLNCSVAWFNQNNLVFSDQHPNAVVSSGYVQDLDMCIYKENLYGTLIPLGGSGNSNSSTEMTYIPLSANDDLYTIEVGKCEADEQSVRYGYAWSTDAIEYQNNSNEGIFFITNKRSRDYLDSKYDGTVYQNSTCNNNNNTNWWILKKNNNENYTICNVAKDGVLTKGISMSAGGFNACLQDDINSIIEYLADVDNDGAVTTRDINFL